MPRVSRADIPVEQAVIAPTGVNLGSSTAGRGLQQLGAEVSRAGDRLQAQRIAEKNVQLALDKELLKQKNITGNNTATGLMMTGTDEIDISASALSKQSPDNWEEITKEIVDRNITEFNKNKAGMQEEVFKAAQEDMKFWGIKQMLATKSRVIKAKSFIALREASIGLEAAIAGGNKDQIERTTKIYEDASSQILTPQETADSVRKITIRGKETRTNTIQNNYIKHVIGTEMTDKQAQGGIEFLDLTREEKTQLSSTVTKRIKVRDEEKAENDKSVKESNYIGLLENSVGTKSPPSPRAQQQQNALNMFKKGQITKEQWSDMDNRLTVKRKTIPEANANALDIIYKVGTGAITLDDGKELMTPLIPLLSDQDAVARIADLQKDWNNAHSTALGNSISESKKMHTVQFTSAGIFSNDALEAFFPKSGKSPEEKAEMNKRFLLEQKNINLYNMAMANWYREESVKKDLTVQEIERKSLDLRSTYERNLLLNTIQFENKITTDLLQTAIEPDRPPATTPSETVGPPIPAELKKIEEEKRQIRILLGSGATNG